MRYLITTAGGEPFFSDFFEPENHFSENVGMVVFDLVNHTYTTDGATWVEIKEDHL